MSYSTTEIWLLIAAIGAGTFLIRFSFLGLIGDRSLPGWALRLLRYTPVAVLPGLVAPLVVWPGGPEGGLSIPHLAAAALTVAAGKMTGSLVWALVAGAAGFGALSYLIS
jgi:branched-subunit amino acid transport protein